MPIVFFLASRWVSQNRWYVTVFQDPENDHFRSSQPAVNTKMAQTGWHFIQRKHEQCWAI